MATKIKGIDVSRYQGNIDWEKVKADGVKFAILKTVSTNKSFGGIYIDPYFERNYAECKRLGIPVGVYYYTYAQNRATADAELAMFKKAVAGKTFEYPLIVDVEDNLLKPISKAALTDLIEYAVKTIESWGCYAMVYTYLSYSNTELDMDRLAKYDLWIAHYSSVCGYKKAHGMWQYSSKGSVKGVSGNCDMNWAYKNYPSIIQKANLNGFANPKKSTPSASTTANGTRIAVGDTVKVLKAEQYDNGRPFRAWFSTYTVKQINGNRVVITKAGVVVAAVHKDNLKKV